MEQLEQFKPCNFVLPCTLQKQKRIKCDTIPAPPDKKQE